MKRLVIPVAALVIAFGGALFLGAGDLLRPGLPPGQVSPAEARAIAVEQQLLCPQCTNKRLDTCDIEICQDMRREIRARLGRGEDENDILRFFAGRYGDRILTALPTRGFPLWLWTWVAGSIGAVTLLGAMWLRGQRRAPASTEGALLEADDRWLDSLVNDAAPREG